MLKKLLAAAVAIAMMVSLFILPSAVSAATFSDSLVFNADYTKKTTADQTGNFTFARTGGSFAENQSEYGIDVPCLITDSCPDGRPKYTGNITLDDTFTFEAFLVSANTESCHDILITNGFMTLEYDQGSGFGFYGSVGGPTDGTFRETREFGNEKTPLLQGNHIVCTVNNGVVKMYINNVLIGTGSCDTGISQTIDTIYVGSGCGYYVAFARIYNEAATEGDVASLYAARNGEVPSPSESTEPTPSESTEPSPTESVEPSPTDELPVLPSGEDFTVTAEDVPAFKAGDTVTLKFTVSEIAVASGMLGMDLYFEYDPTVLQPVMTYDEEEEEDVLALESSSEAINSASGSSKCAWWAAGKINETDPEHPVIEITMLEDNGNEKYAVTEAGQIWVSVTFTALADGTVGDLLAYTTAVGGTTSENDEVGTIEGTGSYVYIVAAEEPSESPSQEPSESPSQEPSESPSQEPSESPADPTDPGKNPVTFDAGLISLAAVAISSFVAVKKRKF